MTTTVSTIPEGRYLGPARTGGGAWTPVTAAILLSPCLSDLATVPIHPPRLVPLPPAVSHHHFQPDAWSLGLRPGLSVLLTCVPVLFAPSDTSCGRSGVSHSCFNLLSHLLPVWWWQASPSPSLGFSFLPSEVVLIAQNQQPPSRDRRRQRRPAHRVGRGGNGGAHGSQASL